MLAIIPTHKIIFFTPMMQYCIRQKIYEDFYDFSTIVKELDINQSYTHSLFVHNAFLMFSFLAITSLYWNDKTTTPKTKYHGYEVRAAEMVLLVITIVLTKDVENAL